MNKHIIASIADLKDLEKRLIGARQFLAVAIEQETDLRIETYGGYIQITVKTTEGLTAARKLYRAYFGTWHDSAIAIRSAGTNVGDNNFAWVIYEDERWADFAIHFDCTIGMLPEDLKKEGCGFKQTTRKTVTYACDV